MHSCFNAIACTVLWIFKIYFVGRRSPWKSQRLLTRWRVQASEKKINFTKRNNDIENWNQRKFFRLLLARHSLVRGMRKIQPLVSACVYVCVWGANIVRFDEWESTKEQNAQERPRWPYSRDGNMQSVSMISRKKSIACDPFKWIFYSILLF